MLLCLLDSILDFFQVAIVILFGLAISDLIVGVSNDAVNFLNSALGSKAIPFRTILIVASIGIAFGAISSSGLMEVARKGIFNPGEFFFAEIMIIFMAVMITDVLILDFFNTLGMPTSTTGSAERPLCRHFRLRHSPGRRTAAIGPGGSFGPTDAPSPARGRNGVRPAA